MEFMQDISGKTPQLLIIIGCLQNYMIGKIHLATALGLGLKIQNIEYLCQQVKNRKNRNKWR